jgi:thiamine pyrophosphate-dependent acetolactate synthase large subunit-like protein
MQGNDVCIRALVEAEVQTVFTLMSEDVMSLVARIESEWAEALSAVDVRHEQNAVAMADAYARATGDLGVCLVGRGPGLAQTGNALTTAGKANSNVLVLAAESALDSQTEDKHFDQEGYLRSTLGEVVSVRSGERLPDRLTDTLRRLRGGEGPIAVQIPKDVLNGDVPGVDEDWRPTTDDLAPPTQSDARVVPDPTAIERAVDSYLDSGASKPPLILAGAGARQAGAKEAIESLAERTSAILATTLRAHGLFEDHPYNVGLVGTLGTNVANERLADSDFVLAVGASLNDNTTDGGRLISDEATVVHADTDPVALGRHLPVDVSIVGDAKTAVRRFDEELERMGVDFSDRFWSEQMRRRIEDGSAVSVASTERDPEAMHPGSLVSELDELLPDERLVVSDGGHFTMWVLDGVTVERPEDFVWLYEFSSIGTGVPAGIGAARSLLDRSMDQRCVVFCGDGGFMMTLQELDTAVRHDVPLTVVVMNDRALGAEYHKLDKHGEDPASAVVDTPPIADVAEAMGATGHTIATVEDLHAIADRLADPSEGPLVLDCRTDRDVRHRYYH